MYVDVSLSLTPEQGKRLSNGQAIRITKKNVVPKVPLVVTATQFKKIKNIADGTQGYMLLKLSTPALKKTIQQHGGSFFGSIGKFLKKTFTTPSGILGVASMIPSPFSGPLRVAATATKLAGRGYGAGRRKLFNVDEFNTSESDHMYHVPELNTEANRVHLVEETLTGMGFKAHHIRHMHGHGVFSTLWKGAKKLGAILKPYVKKEGIRMLKEYGPGAAKKAAQFAINKFLGSGREGKANMRPRRYIVKFTKPQLDYIRRNMVGNGVFSDIGGNLTTLGSV